MKIKKEELKFVDYKNEAKAIYVLVPVSYQYYYSTSVGKILAEQTSINDALSLKYAKYVAKIEKKSIKSMCLAFNDFGYEEISEDVFNKVMQIHKGEIDTLDIATKSLDFLSGKDGLHMEGLGNQDDYYEFYNLLANEERMVLESQKTNRGDFLKNLINSASKMEFEFGGPKINFQKHERGRNISQSICHIKSVVFFLPFFSNFQDKEIEEGRIRGIS